MANLLEALLDILRGLFRSQMAILETALSFVRTVVGESASVVNGVVSFVLGNIVVLGFIGAAIVGWTMYQQNQGRVAGAPGKTGAGRKKLA